MEAVTKNRRPPVPAPSYRSMTLLATVHVPLNTRQQYSTSSTLPPGTNPKQYTASSTKAVHLNARDISRSLVESCAVVALSEDSSVSSVIESLTIHCTFVMCTTVGLYCCRQCNSIPHVPSIVQV